MVFISSGCNGQAVEARGREVGLCHSRDLPWDLILQESGHLLAVRGCPTLSGKLACLSA